MAISRWSIFWTNRRWTEWAEQELQGNVCCMRHGVTAVVRSGVFGEAATVEPLPMFLSRVENQWAGWPGMPVEGPTLVYQCPVDSMHQRFFLRHLGALDIGSGMREVTAQEWAQITSRHRAQMERRVSDFDAAMDDIAKASLWLLLQLVMLPWCAIQWVPWRRLRSWSTGLGGVSFALCLALFGMLGLREEVLLFGRFFKYLDHDGSPAGVIAAIAVWSWVPLWTYSIVMRLLEYLVAKKRAAQRRTSVPMLFRDRNPPPD